MFNQNSCIEEKRYAQSFIIARIGGSELLEKTISGNTQYLWNSDIRNF